MTPERYRKLRSTLERRQPDLTVLMDDVHKDHNLSAILRTADAVGIINIHAVSPGHEVARHHKMAGGSRKWVTTRLHPDIETAVGRLHDDGFSVVAAHFSNRAQDFRTIDFTRPTAVLMGSELRGVSNRGAELADQHAVIPMQGMVASLNVSVAAALILYEAQRQRQNAGLYDQPRLDEAVIRRKLFEWAYPRIARHCRDRGKPYPELDEDGYLRTG